MLSRLAAALDRVLAALLTLLLVAMIAAVTWQVVSRYLLGNPSGWTEELARFLLIWIGIFGGAFAYHRRLHLGVELLGERLEGAPRRWHGRFLDACVLAFAIAILGVGGSSLVALTHELAQFSPALGLPMAVVYLCLPASGVFMAVSALAALADGRR
jgi:TRAP-type C4-dicarboxylate transport system permease small subunit